MAIALESKTVAIKYKTATGEEVKQTAPVKYFQFGELTDLSHYISQGGDEKTKALRLKEVLQNVNYAFSQMARQAVRTEVLKTLVGPDKAINKMVEQYMEARAKAKKPVTEEQARKVVLAMWEAEQAETEDEAVEATA